MNRDNRIICLHRALIVNHINCASIVYDNELYHICNYKEIPLHEFGFNKNSYHRFSEF